MSECVVVAMAAAVAMGLIPYPQPLFQSAHYRCLLNRLFFDSSKSHTDIVQVANSHIS